MLRKLFCAVIVMVVAVGFVAAADFNGIISKCDGDKVTFQEMTKAKKGEKAEKVGDEKKLTVAADAKIVTSKSKATESDFRTATCSSMPTGDRFLQECRCRQEKVGRCCAVRDPFWVKRASSSSAL